MAEGEPSVPSVDVAHVFTPRKSTLRPCIKLTVGLIDTYKNINKKYYENRAAKAKNEEGRGGVNNNGYDDSNYDYIVCGEEVFHEHYVLKHRLGKGSFGQVVCAYDTAARKEVAIKIIKSRKPFTLQAQSEIELLQLVLDKDEMGASNVVQMTSTFMFRNHQCIVFEMLSYNLYDLLRNTKFNGVSLNLARKFARQLLHSLAFFARPDVDIIHCDLKPENILLRHPRRSQIKIIDLGSSCQSTKRTYTYIQSRFYRSPEILLGIKYDKKIDIWSLGCLLVEMHTGEPLFAGTNQIDQMCRIVDLMGMPDVALLELSPEPSRSLFFERIEIGAPFPPGSDPKCTQPATDGTHVFVLKRPANKTAVTKSTVPAVSDEGRTSKTDEDKDKDTKAPEEKEKKTLTGILGVHTGGPHGRRKNEAAHSPENYIEFLDLIMQMLKFMPSERVSAVDALAHPYLLREDITAATDRKQSENAKESIKEVTNAAAESSEDKGVTASSGVTSSEGITSTAITSTAADLPNREVTATDEEESAKQRSVSAPLNKSTVTQKIKTIHEQALNNDKMESIPQGSIDFGTNNEEAESSCIDDSNEPTHDDRAQDDEDEEAKLNAVKCSNQKNRK